MMAMFEEGDLEERNPEFCRGQRRVFVLTRMCSFLSFFFWLPAVFSAVIQTYVTGKQSRSCRRLTSTEEGPPQQEWVFSGRALAYIDSAG